ncbi:MAG: ROK family transcriptional regulator [Bryobacterales bacterium]|nr:ROK family transcriptional regulator [Bryobacterales bacterium]
MPAITFTTRGGLDKSTLRQANERLILSTIRQNPAVSRADIVRITGLSPSSVTFIVSRLRREGLVSEEARGSRAVVGRQPIGLRLIPDARLAVGLDITLSGARIAVGDLSDTIVARRHVPWTANYNVFFDRIHSHLHQILEPLGAGRALGVGVTLPGFIDRKTGKVIAAENLNWFGVEAGSLIRRDLAVPFYFENMAKASAVAEMWSSQRDVTPLRDFVFVSCRSGLGTGVIINGQVLQGTDSAASEFGHVSINPQGIRCPCGNVGCWERYASDLALSERYAARVRSGQGTADSVQIAALARKGDRDAMEVIQETAHFVGLGFVNLIVTLNPEAIIVGDFLSEAWDLLEETVWATVRSRVPAYCLPNVRIVRSRHGSEASLVGGAVPGDDEFLSEIRSRLQGAPSQSGRHSRDRITYPAESGDPPWIEAEKQRR